MRIFLFGPSGVGKTTIGKVLSQKMGIPFFELDKVFWDFQKNCCIDEDNERSQIIEKLLNDNNDRIIEGMYRQDWLNEIISRSDYIFIIQKSKLLIDTQLIYRTIKRIFGFEKSERKSSLKMIINFIKFNHSCRFENTHLKEFNQRLSILNKKAIYISNIQEIEKMLDGKYLTFN